MVKQCKMGRCFLIFLCVSCFFPSFALAQQNQKATAKKAPNQLAISQSVICEGIKDFAPINEAAVFSITIGSVYCYSYFDPIPEETFIYHNWYFRDELTARIKLTLKPPRWKTYSTIQLREADKGPWRVEITGPKGNKYHILRFSITD